MKFLINIFCKALVACVVFSCNLNSTEKVSAHELEIISIMYDSLSKRRETPSPNVHGVSKEDSVRALQIFNQFQDSVKTTKQIIALYPTMEPVEIKIKPLDYNEDQKKLIKQLLSINEQKPLQIEKISTNKLDSIIRFEDHLLKLHSSDYFHFDKLITFSRVAFNPNQDEAVLIASAGTSQLSTFTGIYFFKKVKNEWKIIDSRGLFMS